VDGALGESWDAFRAGRDGLGSRRAEMIFWVVCGDLRLETGSAERK